MSQKTSELKERPRLIALDLDGVVLVEGELDQDAREVLWELRRTGVKLATASGRSFAEQRHIVGHERLFDALVCDEGDVFLLNDRGYEPHRPWNQRRQQRWETVMPAARELVTSASQHFRHLGYGVEQDPKEDENRKRLTLTLANSEAARECRYWLAERADERILRVIQNRRDVAVGSNLTGKGLALAGLANRWNLAAREVLCIGDSNNDADMVAGPYGFRGAVPGDAEEELVEAVRERGGMVAERGHPEGTVELLRGVMRE